MQDDNGGYTLRFVGCIFEIPQFHPWALSILFYTHQPRQNLAVYGENQRYVKKTYTLRRTVTLYS